MYGNHKTLLFAPMWLGEDRLERNTKWLSYYNKLIQEHHLHCSEILLVDNGSESKRLKQLYEFLSNLHVKVTIIECHVHIPRVSLREYEYWYRAFRIALVYAKKHGFTRVLHVDTDMFLLNRKICYYINGLDKGWNTLWCSRHNFPESTFQMICEDQLTNALDFYTIDYLKHFGKEDAENIIPWTNICKDFKGDRYGELNLQQSPDMDYYCQCLNQTPIQFIP